METEDLDKILSKSYSELNTAERETIQEICGSEEEFLQLQQFFASVENYAKETQEEHFPAPETKERLDELFHQTYQNKGILWYNSAWTALYPTEKRFDQRPLVRIAAILVVLISIVPFLDRPSETKTALAKQESLQTKEKKETIDADQDKTVKAEVKANQNIIGKTAQVEGIDLADDASIKYLAPLMETPESTFAPSVAVAGAVTTFSLSTKDVATYNWSHSDGIYMDTFTYDAQDFTLRQNMAVLDLLTPTF